MRYSDTKNMILAALFSVLTVVGGFISIPAAAAPITMQYFFTLMSGIILGKKWGALSQLIYLLVGLAGFPVFTQGGGLSYFMQPSFGFLLALAPAAWIAGYLTEKGCSPRRAALAGLAGDLILYLIGIPYMYIIMHLYLGSSSTIGALLGAMLIYVPGDALKIAAAAVLAPAIVRALPGHHSRAEG